MVGSTKHPPACSQGSCGLEDQSNEVNDTAAAESAREVTWSRSTHTSVFAPIQGRPSLLAHKPLPLQARSVLLTEFQIIPSVKMADFDRLFFVATVPGTSILLHCGYNGIRCENGHSYKKPM